MTNSKQTQPPFHPHTRVVVEGFRLLHKHLEGISQQLLAIDGQIKDMRKEQAQIALSHKKQEK